MAEKFRQSLTKYIIFILVVALSANQPVWATTGNSTGYSWAEKFGYIKWTDGGALYDGALVSDTELTGYLWSEKTGYISLTCNPLFSTCTADVNDYGVTNDSEGNLSGYAWSEKLGWISFDDTSANNYYQVQIDTVGNFMDCATCYAWSEKAGYISIASSTSSDLFAPGDGYEPVTVWFPTAPPTVTTGNFTVTATTTVTATIGIGNTGGINPTVKGFKYGLTQADTWDVHVDGDFSTGTTTLEITGLTKGTVYYVRAYATNTEGTGYGAYVPINTTIESSPVLMQEKLIFKEQVILK